VELTASLLGILIMAVLRPTDRMVWAKHGFGQLIGASPISANFGEEVTRTHLMFVVAVVGMMTPRYPPGDVNILCNSFGY
jgi:hypothetical protein